MSSGNEGIFKCENHSFISSTIEDWKVCLSIISTGTIFERIRLLRLIIVRIKLENFIRKHFSLYSYDRREGLSLSSPFFGTILFAHSSQLGKHQRMLYNRNLKVVFIIDRATSTECWGWVRATEERSLTDIRYLEGDVWGRLTVKERSLKVSIMRTLTLSYSSCNHNTNLGHVWVSCEEKEILFVSIVAIRDSWKLLFYL